MEKSVKVDSQLTMSFEDIKAEPRENINGSKTKIDRKESETTFLRRELMEMTQNNAALKAKIGEMSNERGLKSPLRANLSKKLKASQIKNRKLEYINKVMIRENIELISQKTKLTSEMNSLKGQIDSSSVEITNLKELLKRSETNFEQKVRESAVLENELKEKIESFHRMEAMMTKVIVENLNLSLGLSDHKTNSAWQNL